MENIKIPEYVEILEQGVEAWDEWRKKNGYAKLSLKGANLAEKELNGINFSNVDLSAEIPHECFLRQQDLTCFLSMCKAQRVLL